MTKLDRLNCTSQKISQQLYELGVELPNFLYHQKGFEVKHWVYDELRLYGSYDLDHDLDSELGENVYPALSLGLLMEVLPEKYFPYRHEGSWGMGDIAQPGMDLCIWAIGGMTASDVCAKMLIYLIEQKHVTVEEVNAKIASIYKEVEGDQDTQDS